jgi:hypothetical protein
VLPGQARRWNCRIQPSAIIDALPLELRLAGSTRKTGVIGSLEIHSRNVTLGIILRDCVADISPDRVRISGALPIQINYGFLELTPLRTLWAWNREDYHCGFHGYRLASMAGATLIKPAPK